MDALSALAQITNRPSNLDPITVAELRDLAASVDMNTGGGTVTFSVVVLE